VAVNTPYSGNHILERHGMPARGIHAIQVEVDRSLYLGPDLMTPCATLPAVRRLLGDLAQALSKELSGPGIQLAAE
jgi:N-formylglutamate amidohydrolase